KERKIKALEAELIKEKEATQVLAEIAEKQARLRAEEKRREEELETRLAEAKRSILKKFWQWLNKPVNGE
ncbi:MAG: hypothetical protein OEW43_01600, partial [Elusimicrobiota bacterium]|nr:hypothetical protein [Elusimicrobiota bacterium]